jgi:hypothetical protein
MNSANLCSLAGRYDTPLPTRFIAPIDCLKISALVLSFKKRMPIDLFRIHLVPYTWSRSLGPIHVVPHNEILVLVYLVLYTWPRSLGHLHLVSHTESRTFSPVHLVPDISRMYLVPLHLVPFTLSHTRTLDLVLGLAHLVPFTWSRTISPVHLYI